MLRDPRATWKPWELRWAWWDWRDGWDRFRQRHLLAILTDIDDGTLGEAEVPTKVVNTLHPSFAGIT